MVSRPTSLLDEADDEPLQPAHHQLTVNEDYAQRFAHNKKREALHRLQELEKRGMVDSSDDDEDEDEDEDDDGILPTRTEVQIFDTLAKIKRRDPSIYSEEAKFFDDLDSGAEEEVQDRAGKEADKKKKKKKPVYLKDALANQLIEEGPDFQEEVPKQKAFSTYAEEQQELKSAFLQSVGSVDSDEDEDAGLLKVRRKTANDFDTERQHVEGPEAEREQQRAKDADIARRLEEYFGGDDDLDENEKFLKSYLLNKSWIDEEQNRIPSYDEIVGDIIEDEEELEKQDKFEAEYNFRFEEGPGSQVLGHSRVVEGSVRRKDDTRKKLREKKKEKASEEALERREELKRLKNLKKKEILGKLEKIRNVAGAKVDDTNLLQEEDLEEDFDPEEYDRKMREAFGEEYYGAEDPDENFQGYDSDGMEKPDFDAEDELLGLPKDWDKAGTAGFAAARDRTKEIQNAGTGAEFSSEEENSEEDAAEDGSTRLKGISKRKKKGKISLREKLAFDKQLEEYYKLDYEDVIGDLPTRFKYRQVKPNMYGLTASEILTEDDKDLNQYVSLKKLAPYVTQEWKPQRRYHLSQKMRKKKALQHQPSTKVPKSDGSSFIGNNSHKDQSVTSTSNDLTQPSNGEIEGSKRKRKKRRKGLVISQSRLFAYGKISAPKKRRKQA